MIVYNYSTKVSKVYRISKASRASKLDPWYITGITDAEGCFNVTVTRSSSTRIGWRVQLRYIIELHVKDVD